MVKFSTNPILFKINYMNRDRFDSAQNVSGVIGRAFHAAMEALYTEQSIERGLEVGTQFLEEHPEGFINFSKTVDTKQKAIDKFVFAYNSYIHDAYDPKEEVLACEDLAEEYVDVEWNGNQVSLPVALKGYLDKIVRDKKKRLCIIDYKTCSSFSNPDKIDGAKILQAVQYYFLAYAKYGEEPYSFTYQEVKLSQNRDGSPQVREYEIVYKDNLIYFDFYFRFYEDMLRALNGEQVYVPNIYTMFDNEVSIIAYIQRLDVPDEVAKRMKKAQVNTISELLKKEMQNVKNMNRLMKAAEKAFVTAKSIDYSSMGNDDKIRTKMLEHGLVLNFDSKVEGASVDLYRFAPSIGLKMSRIRKYADDVEQVLGVSGVRILAPIPNSTLIGFEVPRKVRRFPEVPADGAGFDIAIGQTVLGEERRFDLREAPHVLIAGASGSGKSVFLNALIKQLAVIDDVELHLMDPKRVELVQHKKVAEEYCNTPEAINEALLRLENEMDQRYKKMEKKGVRHIGELPGHAYKFVIIDEFGELSALGAADDEGKTPMARVLRLAQLARAAGIHMIVATQRPSVDIITGTIKANFPTKVAFRTAKATDSRIILDDQGAEKLMGKGDMLFQSDEGVERLQGYNA